MSRTARSLLAGCLLATSGCIPIGAGVWALVDDGGSSGGGGAGPPTTPPAPQAPLTAPAALTGVLVNGAVELSWTAASGELGYALERRAVGDTTWTPLSVLPPGATLHRDTSVPLDASLEYRVSAFNQAEVRASNQATVASLPYGADALVARGSGDTVALTWIDRSAVETGYEVQRDAGAGFSSLAVLPASTTSFLDTGLQLDGIYSYRLVTQRGALSSAPSSTVAAVTGPRAVASLASVAPIATQVDVSWVDTNANELQVRVERRVGGGAYATVAVLPPGATSYADLAVTPGTGYSYRVYVSNASGESQAAGPASCLSPPAVTGVSPDKGDVAGGTSLTITGEGLGPAFAPEINGLPCVNVSYVSSTTLTCEAPASDYVAGQALELVAGADRRVMGSFFYEGQLPQRVVSALPDQDTDPAIAIDEQNRYHAVHRRFPGGGGGSSLPGDLVYTQSVDQGRTWTSPVVLGAATPAPGAATIAQSGSTLLVVWSQSTGVLGELDAYLARSTDLGATWSSPMRINTTPTTARDPTVVIEGSLALVAWHDVRSGSQDLYLMRSSDGGASWGPNTPFGPSSDEQQSPSLALQGQLVLCTFDHYVAGPPVDQDVYLTRSTDGGQTWSPAVEVSDTNIRDQQNSTVAISGNLVLLTWEDESRPPPSNPNLYRPDVNVRRSTDGGLTWPDPSVRLTPDLHAINVASHLALDGNLAVVGWQGSNHGHRVSTDGGLTWFLPVDTQFGSPRVAVRDGIYVVIGERATGSTDVFTVTGASKP